ncbi:glutamate ABC transporter substrate-binding protein [Nocardia sp. NPDC057227]|uniref:glutamate ABC transporter substrate-binding protein n=1 Tax=Nocardia sp. NPDC057227 TaxID=3346056 RepID=UPI0036282872
MSTSLRTRGLAATAVAAAAALLLSACGDSSLPAASGTDADAYQQVIANAPVAAAADIPAGSLMAAIRDRGELVQGGTDTAAIFSLTDPATGKTTGFDAGLAAMLAKYITGKPAVKLVQVQVGSREALLQSNAVDAVIATYTITPQRAEKVGFAGPYYSSGNAILVRRGDTEITEVGHLNDRTVCTQTSSTAAQNIAKFAPSARIVLFDTNAQCVQAVQQGRADAYVIDQALLLGSAYREPDKVKVVGEPFTAEPYGIGTPPNHPEMKTFVNDWLRKIQADGSWAALWRATVGTTVEGEVPAPPAIGSVPGS